MKDSKEKVLSKIKIFEKDLKDEQQLCRKLQVIHEYSVQELKNLKSDIQELKDENDAL